MFEIVLPNDLSMSTDDQPGFGRTITLAGKQPRCRKTPSARRERNCFKTLMRGKAGIFLVNSRTIFRTKSGDKASEIFRGMD